MNTLAQRLKYARELANLSQQEVAKRANISQPTYFKIENGSTLKPRNILEIAHALNVNVDWLATGEGEMMHTTHHLTTLAQRLKYARESMKLTQNDVAEAVGITQPTYQALESGKVTRTSHLLEIAEVLEIDAHWLATGENETTDPLAKRIQTALNRAGISWSKAATTIGLSAQAATKWKKGQISRDTLQELANLLGVHYTWLATGEGEMKDSNTNYSTPTTDYEPSTSTIELIETLKEMEKTGELTPQVVGLLNATLNTVKSVSIGKRLSVSHLVESSNE